MVKALQGLGFSDCDSQDNNSLPGQALWRISIISAAQAQSENSVKNQTHNAIYSFIESHLFTSEDMLGEHEIMMTTTPMQGVYLLGP